MNLFLYAPGTVCATAAPGDSASWATEAPLPDNNRLPVLEPDYTAFIAPMQLRRMSRAVRMGVAAARMSLRGTTLEKPEALSIGTALGCLQDTEVFLAKMTEQNEQMLTPTAFIQSTHNTVAGQIALLLGCNGHNLTYVHRGLSTEHALINAWLYLRQHPGETVLCGGLDELTDSSYTLMERAGVYADTFAGEGAGFFLATPEAPAQKAVQLIHLFQTSHMTPAEAASVLMQRLREVLPEAPQLVLSGQTTDNTCDAFYAAADEQWRDVPKARFKNGTGEFATAVSAGVAQLLQSLQTGSFPSWWNTALQPEAARTIVVWNNYLDSYSCWVLVTG